MMVFTAHCSGVTVDLLAFPHIFTRAQGVKASGCFVYDKHFDLLKTLCVFFFHYFIQIIIVNYCLP